MANETDEQVNIEADEQANVIEELDDNNLDEVSGGTPINNCLNAVEGCGCG